MDIADDEYASHGPDDCAQTPKKLVRGPPLPLHYILCMCSVYTAAVSHRNAIGSRGKPSGPASTCRYARPPRLWMSVRPT